MNITLLHGETALLKLQSSEFAQAWRTLYQACPWATGFQSWEYAQHWYPLYQHYTPWLILGYDSPDKLVGVLPLAYHSTEDHLCHLGDGQAEYQVWLSLPKQNTDFITQALAVLQAEGLKQAIDTHLELSYLPSNTPLDWQQSNHPSAQRSYVTAESRNIMPLTPESVSAYSRGKKRLKTKFNKLKRQGAVQLKFIQTRAEFEQAAEQMIPHFDFRQGAVNHFTPFRSNPLKYQLYCQLVEAGRLHVSALYLDDEVIAGLMGMQGKGQVHLDEIMHAVWHQNLSPGALHLWQLIPALAEQGHTFFDLTPGGDSYKNRISAIVDEVYHLTVYPSRGAQQKKVWTQQAKRGMRALIEQLPEQGEWLFEALQKLRTPFKHDNAASTLHSVEAWTVYQAATPPTRNWTFHNKRLNDLMAYPCEEDGDELYAFWYAALIAIYQGASFDCVLDDVGKLRYAGFSEITHAKDKPSLRLSHYYVANATERDTLLLAHLQHLQQQYPDYRIEQPA